MLLPPWKLNPDFDNTFSPTVYGRTPWRFLRRDHERPIDTFRVDMVDTLSSYKVQAEMPGRKKESIKILIDNGYLIISAENGKHEREEDEPSPFSETVIISEIKRGKMSRTIPLPENVDEDAVVASYENGVLDIILPKTGKSSREISIM